MKNWLRVLLISLLFHSLLQAELVHKEKIFSLGSGLLVNGENVAWSFHLAECIGPWKGSELRQELSYTPFTSSVMERNTEKQLIQYQAREWQLNSAFSKDWFIENGFGLSNQLGLSLTFLDYRGSDINGTSWARPFLGAGLYKSLKGPTLLRAEYRYTILSDNRSHALSIKLDFGILKTIQ